MNTTTTARSRYEGLDILKAICAFLIVCIHAPFPGSAGGYITALARIAVPVFFMITGFFYDSVSSGGREVRQIKKIFLLFLYGNFLFFAYRLGISLVKGSTAEYLHSAFTLKNLVKFVIFNESMFNGHLWYLGAILYVLIIVYVLKRFVPKWKQILYFLSPFLLIGDLVLGKYSLLLLGRELPSYVLVRNFLFVGIPYFTIGVFMKDKDICSMKNKHVLCPVLIVVFAATTILERMLLIVLDANTVRDHYLSSTLLAAVMFIAFTGEAWNTGRCRLLKTIGQKYATWVYILHPLVITVLGAVIARVHILETPYGYVRPVIVYIATVILAAVCCKIKDMTTAHLRS